MKFINMIDPSKFSFSLNHFCNCLVLWN